jgi:hypothetical protein
MVTRCFRAVERGFIARKNAASSGGFSSSAAAFASISSSDIARNRFQSVPLTVFPSSLANTLPAIPPCQNQW